MKKFLSVMASALLLAVCVPFSACDNREKILIYTSCEDYTMEYLDECMKKDFPDYKVEIEYMATNNIAARVIEEGESSDCDIIFAQEYGYLAQMANAGVLAKLADLYDYSVYLEDTLESDAKDYLLPALRVGGGVIINNNVLQRERLEKPTSYSDLLDEKYKGLVSMPSPKSSGTGYMFYLSLVNEMGEAAALEYFDNLTPNVLAYTTSGSGPVNALVSREAAVGFGMLSQAVEKINSGVNELEILFFDEGAPFNLYGNAIVKGKENRSAVKEVMDYLYSTFTDAVCAKFYPEPVLKDKQYTLPNFPKNINYSDMKNNTLTRKEDLLAKWKN